MSTVQEGFYFFIIIVIIIIIIIIIIIDVVPDRLRYLCVRRRATQLSSVIPAQSHGDTYSTRDKSREISFTGLWFIIYQLYSHDETTRIVLFCDVYNDINN